MATPERTVVVTIVYTSLPQYRVAFYEKLRRYLRARGIELRLVVGQPPESERTKGDRAELPWAVFVPNRIMRVGSREIYWQPCTDVLRGSDLVIVEQASKLLLNYVLLAWQAVGGPRLALWGHGQNLRQHAASTIGEAIKRAVTRRAHWFFAYTDRSAQIVRGVGHPPGQQTVVQNAIDTAGLQRAAAEVSAEQLAHARRDAGITGQNVCLYVGGIYPEKRMGFLIEAAHQIRALIPDFELVVIGSGSDADMVREAAHDTPWIRYVGPMFDDAKALYARLAKVMLLPGLVGLAVLDSFALGLPLITIDVPYHAPEIEYLVDGLNGTKLPADTTPLGYARAVVALLCDDDRRRQLEQGCREAAATYTIETMVERFGSGIIEALDRSGAHAGMPGRDAAA